MRMKTKMIVFTMLLCPILIFGQTWDYPVKPGTEGWENMTYKEHIKAYNIPIDLLFKISTENLLQTCLNYPEWRLINTYDDIEIGFMNVISMFNGFEELFKREKSAYDLVNHYKMLEPFNVQKNWSDLQKGEYAFKILCAELLLSHKSMVEQLDVEMLKSLLGEAVNKYDKKALLPDVYSIYSVMPTAILSLRAMDKLNSTSSEYEKFKKTLYSTENNAIVKIQFIINQAKKELK